MSDTPPMPAVPPTPPTRADVGAAISWAFDRFKSNAAAFIGLAAVVTVIQLVQQIGTGPLRNILTDCSDAQTTGQINACLAATSTYAIVTIIIAIVFGFLAFLAQIGVQRAAIRSTQGVTPSFDAMLTTQNLGKYIGYILLYAVLFFLGLVLCILPGLVVLFLFQLGPFYILDKGTGVIDAFRSSINAVTKNIGPALLMTLVNALVAILGGMLFGILTLVTLPFASLFTAHMYRQFNGEPVH